MKKFLPLFSLFAFFSIAAPAKAESDAYKYCMLDAAKVGDNAIAECMKAENGLMVQNIYKEYDKLSKNANFQKWNNGSGMFRGRLKNLYENWTKYKDEYCDLYVLSMTNYTGTEEYNRQACLLELNKLHLLYISSIIKNYNTTAD